MRTSMKSIVTVALAFLAWGSLPAEEVGWPREIKTKDAVIVIYQPQPETLEGNILTARTAVSVAQGGATPVFGAVWGTAALDIDKDARTVTAITMSVDRVRFPDVDESKQAELRTLLEKEFADLDMTMSLDRLMTSLEASEREQEGQELKSDPPSIIFSSRPALLVSIDGDPELRPIADTKLMRVVNTPFPIVFDPARKTYYLYGSSVWFATDDLVYGEWEAIDAPPGKVAALFRGEERAEGAPTQPPAGEGVPPERLRQARIIVATVPSELIVSEGDPRWSPVVSGDLLALSNSDSSVFQEVDTGRYYVLLSGRWYRSKGLDGPWTHVPPPDLPAVFAKIPSNSKYADVRASIPGTSEAEDAVADAMIPQTAAVSRQDAKVEVSYDGKPKFERIPGTKLLLATNTASQVLKIDGRFWLCEQGVWYVGETPEGPWVVADERPEGVDDIPASSPAYNVKYVYIYDSTPDYVYVGYLPGYLGAYPYYGTVVYGTGWYYPAYISPYYYYPHAWTWGFGARYSPWYGWGYGFSWSLGWASFSWGWGYGWGGWYHGYYPGYYPYPYGYAAGWNAGYWAGVHAGGYFGPGGYCPTWSARHPRTASHGTVVATGTPARVPRSAAYNLYARSENPNARALRPASQRPTGAPTTLANGRSTRPTGAGAADPRSPRAATPPTAKRPEPTATRPTPGATRPTPAAPARPSTTAPGRPTSRPATGARNNVYVDPNGDIYRYNNQKWEHRQQGRWQPVDGDPTAAGRGQGTTAGRPTSMGSRGTAGRAATQPSPTRPAPTRAPGRPTASTPPAAPSQAGPQQATPPNTTRGSVNRPAPSAPPPSRGQTYGNRAVPRGGPSLDSARTSRERGSARVDQYRGGGGRSSAGMSRAPSGGSRPSSGAGRPSGGGGGRPSGGSRPSGGGSRPHR